jgi:TM2 domain-containing membrane protein YozV
VQASLKNQTVAALLAAFLGGFGVHRFYLGKIVSGVLYLLFCWTGIPGLIALVEIFWIAFMSPENWAEKYNHGQLTEPVHIAIKILVMIFPLIFVIGILAAIAIPAYHDYTVKARAAQTSVL